MNRSRPLIFGFIAIVIIPLLFITCLELGLRLGGYGYDPGIVKKLHENGQDVLRENVGFSRGIFPRKMVQQPMAISFPAHKHPGTYRIFVLGESAALGYPYPAFSFSRILDIMLRDQYPDVRFEVINTGLTAINSHVILKITKALALRQPDLFIIYMGNNEVIGPYGPGTVFSPLVSNLHLLRTVQFVKTTRIGQLLNSVIDYLTGQDIKAPRWRGMSMFVDKQIRADDGRLNKVYEYFQKNLDEILKTARKSGAQIIVSSVVDNLVGIAPFASLHKPTLSEGDLAQWDELYRSGIDYESKGEYQAAIQQFVAASRIDGDFADLHFRLGRCYLALSDAAAAKESFIKARDLDAIRFRPVTRINEIIKEAAANRESENIYFIDAQKIFGQNAPHGITNDEHFYDHVHFNFSGNYLLAREILLGLRSHLPAWVLQTQHEQKPPLTSEECGARLAFTGYQQYILMSELAESLMNRPPFTNMINYEDMIQVKREQVEFLRYYTTPQGLTEAAAAHRSALTQNPSDYLIHLGLARILMELNEKEEAFEHLHRSDELMPNSEAAEILESYQPSGQKN